MQKQMEILLQQIKYPDHQLFLFENKIIEKVDVLRKSNQMMFYLLFDEPLVGAAFFELYHNFDMTFENIKTIQEASFTIKYQREVSDDKIKEYWPLIIEYLSRKQILIRYLESFSIKVEDHNIQIAVSNNQYVQDIEQHYVELIAATYRRFGFHVNRVMPYLCTNAKSDDDLLTEREQYYATLTPP
ncbi:MAG TPA: PolC-type DNA polymerase III, partial [Firmicutes bacterium]|nr:PolC-type DNA polymerase III [Bacillota bacterium]